MFGEIFDKIRKANEQRVKMALTLLNVMTHNKEASLNIRASVAASLLDMLETDMMEEDKDLVRILNEGIDFICNEAKSHGVDNFRVQLKESVVTARKMAEEQLKRVNEGNGILSQVKFDNDLNLN